MFEAKSLAKRYNRMEAMKPLSICFEEHQTYALDVIAGGNEIEFKLDFTYDGMEEAALTDVVCNVGRGRCLVLCGGSGCGKSTLLRCINRLIPLFYEGKLTGFCYVDHKDVSTLSIGEAGELVASVFQDPRSQFFTTDSSSEVAFGLENHGFTHEKIVERVDFVYRESGLEKLKGRNVFELSSGERQLVAILSAWALEVPVILLDEPTANLDSASIEYLKKLLETLKERGHTLIINEHRLYYLRNIADEYLLMEHGEVRARFSAKQLLSLSDQELAALSLRTTDLSGLAYTCGTVEPDIHNRFELLGVKFRYKHGDNILQNISLNVSTGDAIGLIGSNGSGKTTLGKLMAGLVKPGSGDIYFCGNRLSQRKLTGKCIFIMQEAEFQFFTNTVMHELEYGKSVTPKLRETMEVLLVKLGLWELRERHPFSLSGGQMQKLVLLLAYLSDKPVVILDEPTAGLDKNSLQCCVELIAEMRKRKIVFIITHDMELISQSCTRALYISKGIIEREFDLLDGEFSGLFDFMQTHIRLSDNCREHAKQNDEYLCDPRVKLLYLIAAVAVSGGSLIYVVAGAFLATLVVCIYERRYKVAAVSGVTFAALHLLHFAIPGALTSFAALFFPKLLLLWTVAAILAEGGDSSRITAALRRMHIPERVIMICAVVLRFFPVLKNDVGLAFQSIKTRGNPVNIWQRIKRLPEYFEMVMVPMVFRTTRIAEALSASAEVRGIDLTCRRQSHVRLHMKGADFLFILLLVVLSLGGIFVV